MKFLQSDRKYGLGLMLDHLHNTISESDAVASPKLTCYDCAYTIKTTVKTQFPTSIVFVDAFHLTENL